MLKFISKIFKKQQVEKPKGAYYPVDELNKVKDTYENKQLEKAMQAPID